MSEAFENCIKISIDRGSLCKKMSTILLANQDNLKSGNIIKFAWIGRYHPKLYWGDVYSYVIDPKLEIGYQKHARIVKNLKNTGLAESKTIFGSVSNIVSPTIEIDHHVLDIKASGYAINAIPATKCTRKIFESAISKLGLIQDKLGFVGYKLVIKYNKHYASSSEESQELKYDINMQTLVFSLILIKEIDPEELNKKTTKKEELLAEIRATEDHLSDLKKQLSLLG